MLVEASWSILRAPDRDDPLRLWARAAAKRRGKSIAVIALARRLAGVLWAMWRDDTAYDPALLEFFTTSMHMHVAGYRPRKPHAPPLRAHS